MKVLRIAASFLTAAILAARGDAEKLIQSMPFRA